MLQNKANSTVLGPCIRSYFGLVCGGWGLKLIPQKLQLKATKATPVRKKAATVSDKAPKHNCKQRSSAVSRKLPTLSTKAASACIGVHHTCGELSRSGTAKEHKLELIGPDIFRWGGVHHVKGWGQKVRYVPRNPGT